MTIEFDSGHDLERSNVRIRDSDWGDYRCWHAVDSSSFLQSTLVLSVYIGVGFMPSVEYVTEDLSKDMRIYNISHRWMPPGNKSGLMLYFS